MSETDRASDLLADLLGDGPLSAADILAAADRAKVSKRTMQRAANMLQVKKTRAAFRGGWIWRLPDDEAEAPSPAKESEPEKSAAPAGKDDIRRHSEPAHVDNIRQHFAERAETIAARLRKLEAGRGKVAPIHAMDRRLVGWVQSGITDPDLREAYERAVFALERGGSTAPVTVGQLVLIIEQGG